MPHDDTSLVDSYGRTIRTVRISLTDHCNFRCVYCMPPEGLDYIHKQTYLERDHIARLVSLLAPLGVCRVRLTGGEPLLRKDVVEIVAALRQSVPDLELSLTTNASRLAELAGALKQAGLDRMNISLDSLDPRRFAQITRAGQYDRVWAGIDAALAEGFPIKINVVVMRGMPREEIVEFVDLAVEHDIDVRFLEFMPLCGTAWANEVVLPIAEVRKTVRERYDLEELPRGDRPAQAFAIEGGRGRVGFIASLTEPFCDTCSRMRVTADGNIRPCLFSNYEYPVGDLLRAGAPDAAIIDAVRHAVWNKPWGSEFADKPFAEDEPTAREAAATPFIRSIGG